jgi:hypothetical protein
MAPGSNTAPAVCDDLMRTRQPKLSVSLQATKA